VQGPVGALQHYFPMIDDMAKEVGVATPILNCVIPLYQRFMDMGFGGDDVARMVDVLGSLPRDEK
jgi:3-hydroxyisobutyrate dehydrogenase-like beta-hydroxyacid dehydrogenase